MRIGEASRATGASARALRFYEDEGLIVPGRCSNGYRDYCWSTVDRVLAVRSLLESGLPVRMIRKLSPHPAELGDGAGQLRSQLLDEVRAYRDRLTARVAALDAQRSALDVFLREAGREERDHGLTDGGRELDLDADVRLLRSGHGDDQPER